MLGPQTSDDRVTANHAATSANALNLQHAVEPNQSFRLSKIWQSVVSWTAKLARFRKDYADAHPLWTSSAKWIDDLLETLRAALAFPLYWRNLIWTAERSNTVFYKAVALSTNLFETYLLEWYIQYCTKKKFLNKLNLIQISSTQIEEFYLANHPSPIARQNKNKLFLKSARMRYMKQRIPTKSAYTVTFLFNSKALIDHRCSTAFVQALTAHKGCQAWC
jgi:hypothetical protein